MFVKYSLIIAAALTLCTACAHRQPIIDTKGVNMAQYQQDLYECEGYAEQVRVGQRAAGGAVAGAVGAAVSDSDAAKRAAGAGAVVGTTKGTGRAVREQQQVVRNCLRNRGYAVLN